MSILNKIVVASHNEGKVREIRELLIPYGVTTLSAAELSLDEPVETELTFTGNAELKANAAAIAAAFAFNSALPVNVNSVSTGSSKESSAALRVVTPYGISNSLISRTFPSLCDATTILFNILINFLT